MSEILVQPSDLRNVAGQLRNSAQKIGGSLQAIDNDILSLKSDKFLGNRANALQTQYAPRRDALLKAKDLVLFFAADLETAAKIFDQADKSGISAASGTGAVTGTSSNFGFPKWVSSTAIEWIKAGPRYIAVGDTFAND